MKGVLDLRPRSGYDDEVAVRYHFPDRYLVEALRLAGDWVAFREPRREGGRQAYVAAARVVRIEPDRARAAHSYAILSGYIEFDRPVTLRRPDGRYHEDALNAVPAAAVGRTLQGRSVRTIPEDDFGAIVAAGFAETLAAGNAARLGLDDGSLDADTRALLELPPEEQQRRVALILANRKVRDAAFRHNVLAAYDDTCAVTGLRIVNGGGRAEAQAAHIWAVADGGPDVVQNGIALSGTAHWCFDRHLISLTDDLRLLVAHNRIPTGLQSLFGGHMERIRTPNDPSLAPHPAYVARHRERFVAH